MTELAIEMERRTDVGRKRQHNEDFIDFYEPADAEELARGGRLYVVADGVGGAAAGEEASEYAAGKVLHEYYRSTEVDLEERLRAAIGAANADIFEHVEQHPELGRMGTTIVMAAVRGDEVVVANVGDSRAYLIRNGEIHQITRDHSLVAKLVEEGSITPEEAEHHPRRNVVLRSLGVEPDVHADTYKGHLQPGDQIVLCSDGLTRHVSDEEIMGIATRTRVERAVNQLVDLANARGGKDNISVLLLRATEAATPATAPGTVAKSRAPAQPEWDAIRQTAFRRPKAPPLRRPKRVRLAFGSAVGVLVLVIVAFFVLRALEILPALPASTSPIASPSSTIMPSIEETAVSLAPSPTPKPPASLTPVSTPTYTPTPPPISSASMDPQGDVMIYESDTSARDWPVGLDIYGASVASDLRLDVGATAELPGELKDWGRDGELLLWIVLYEPIPDPPAAKIDWLFALDVDGNPDTGRPPGSVHIDPDLGDEAFIGVSCNPDTGEFEPYFEVWDRSQRVRVPGPAEVLRFKFDDKKRKWIGLAVPLGTLAQVVEDAAGSTFVPGAVKWRAAAVSYETQMIDVCPDLPAE